MVAAAAAVAVAAVAAAGAVASAAAAVAAVAAAAVAAAAVASAALRCFPRRLVWVWAGWAQPKTDCGGPPPRLSLTRLVEREVS